MFLKLWDERDFSNKAPDLHTIKWEMDGFDYIKIKDSVQDNK